MRRGGGFGKAAPRRAAASRARAERRGLVFSNVSNGSRRYDDSPVNLYRRLGRNRVDRLRIEHHIPFCGDVCAEVEIDGVFEILDKIRGGTWSNGRDFRTRNPVEPIGNDRSVIDFFVNDVRVVFQVRQIDGVGGQAATYDVSREGEEGKEEGEAFHGLKRLKGLKRMKEFKVERVKGKVAERGGGGVNAEC